MGLRQLGLSFLLITLLTMLLTIPVLAQTDSTGASVLYVGRVGVGTTQSQGRLHVNFEAGDPQSVRFYTPSLANLQFNQIKMGIADGAYQSAMFRYRRDDTNGNTLSITHLGDPDGLTILEGSKVGINSAFPEATLEVVGSGFFNTTAAPRNAGADLQVQDQRDGAEVRLLLDTASNGASEIHFGDFFDADIGRIEYDHTGDFMAIYTNNAEAIRIASSGNVGIGTTSPSYALEVVGTGYASGGWSQPSDSSLKKNITPITDALELVMSLQGVRFAWKHNGRSDVGILAQNLETVLPELVQTDSEGYKAVTYPTLTAVLVEALKAQQEIIEAQQEQIGSLQKKGKTTRSQLTQLGSRLRQLEAIVQSLPRGSQTSVRED